MESLLHILHASKCQKLKNALMLISSMQLASEPATTLLGIYVKEMKTMFT